MTTCVGLKEIRTKSKEKNLILNYNGEKFVKYMGGARDLVKEQNAYLTAFVLRRLKSSGPKMN